jgi:hypothetical protein
MATASKNYQDYGRKFGLKYSHFGQDTKGHDLKVFGDTTANYIFWDASANTFTVAGTFTHSGSYTYTLTAAQKITIDAGTTDHTGSAIIDADLDVNSASCALINATIDVGTALSGGEIMRGIYFDMNEKASCADTSGMYGVDLLMTGIASASADIIGFKVNFDGTKNAGDTTKGILVDADQTINNAGEYLYGVHVDFSGVTHTNGIIYGAYIDITAAVASGTAYGVYIKLDAATTAGLYIDAGTEDRTAGNAIFINWDVNSCNSNMIEATIDIGTLLTAGEVVKGSYFDINEVVLCENGSFIIGYDVLMTGFSTGRADIIGYRVSLDGTKDAADTLTAFTAVGTFTMATSTVYGTYINYSGITHTSGTLYGEYIDVSATVTAGSAYGTYYKLAAATTAIYIDAGTNDHIAGNVIDVNLDVNSASVTLINATIDVGTALSGAEFVKGIYFDMNELAACADTSALIGVDLLMTGIASAQADLVGYKVTFDGTKSGGDTTRGLYVVGTQTLNSGTEYLYGTYIDFSGITQTNGNVYGQYIDVSATVTAGAGYGAYYKLSAETVGIYIDAGSNDHIAGNIIDMNLDVNSASVNALYFDIDVGTALSAGETVNGVKIDIDGNAGDDATSAMNAIYLTSANTSAGLNYAINIQGTFDKSINIASTAGKMDLDVEIDNRTRVTVFDDFLYSGAFEAASPWVLNKGSDGACVDPAVVAATEGGIVILTTGADAAGTIATDGSQIVAYVPMQADSGNLVFECRLHINAAITGISVCAGFTDTTLLEEPFSNAADVITCVADDAVAFVYDADATTKTWWACAVDSTTADTGNATTGTAPTAGTYQTLRIEVSSDGATCRFYIDGTLVKTLTGAAGVSPDVNLYATVTACSTGAASKTVDLDYIYAGCNR